MRIAEYGGRYEQVWRDLFAAYFREVGSDLPEQVIREKVCGIILESLGKGTVSMCLALEEEAPIGFGIYQIDAPESDWCKRPGWGFIREFYVDPAHRALGYGRALTEYIEDRLAARGASALYLTSDGAVAFWERMGYRPAGEPDAEGMVTMTREMRILQ